MRTLFPYLFRFARPYNFTVSPSVCRTTEVLYDYRQITPEYDRLIVIPLDYRVIEVCRD